MDWRRFMFAISPRGPSVRLHSAKSPLHFQNAETNRRRTLTSIGSVSILAGPTEHPVPFLGPCDIGTVRTDAVERAACLDLRCQIRLDLLSPIFRATRYVGRVRGYDHFLFHAIEHAFDGRDFQPVQRSFIEPAPAVCTRLRVLPAHEGRSRPDPSLDRSRYPFVRPCAATKKVPTCFDPSPATGCASDS